MEPEGGEILSRPRRLQHSCTQEKVQGMYKFGKGARVLRDLNSCASFEHTLW